MAIQSTTCIVAMTYTALMPTNSGLKDGKGVISVGSAGVSCPFTVDPDFVSAVSGILIPATTKKSCWPKVVAEEFALIEASYGIVRILQAYPKLKLPPQELQEPTGYEKQSLTIVVSSAEGCRVLLSWYSFRYRKFKRGLSNIYSADSPWRKPN